MFYHSQTHRCSYVYLAASGSAFPPTSFIQMYLYPFLSTQVFIASVQAATPKTLEAAQKVPQEAFPALAASAAPWFPKAYNTHAPPPSMPPPTGTLTLTTPTPPTLGAPPTSPLASAGTQTANAMQAGGAMQSGGAMQAPHEDGDNGGFFCGDGQGPGQGQGQGLGQGQGRGSKEQRGSSPTAITVADTTATAGATCL